MPKTIPVFIYIYIYVYIIGHCYILCTGSDSKTKKKQEKKQVGWSTYEQSSEEWSL